ncbi:unnamed protein product, partial [Mesorhabditis spiculigera]
MSQSSGDLFDPRAVPEPEELPFPDPDGPPNFIPDIGYNLNMLATAAIEQEHSAAQPAVAAKRPCLLSDRPEEVVEAVARLLPDFNFGQPVEAKPIEFDIPISTVFLAFFRYAGELNKVTVHFEKANISLKFLSTGQEVSMKLDRSVTLAVCGPVAFPDDPNKQACFYITDGDWQLVFVRRFEGLKFMKEEVMQNLASTKANIDTGDIPESTAWEIAEDYTTLTATKKVAEDIIALSDDDDVMIAPEAAKESTPQSSQKPFRYPVVTIQYPGGKAKKHEADFITNLIQERYSDSQAITPLMEHHFTVGSAHTLGFINSFDFENMCSIANDSEFKRIRCAADVANMTPRLREKIEKSIPLRRLLTDDANEYTAVVVFCDGKHWYLMIVARLARWLKASYRGMMEMPPPMIYMFDSLLQDTKLLNGNTNYISVPNIHEALLKKKLFPLLKVADQLYGSQKLFAMPCDIRSRDVYEMFGQLNTSDCGAFAMLFAEAIANGELIENKTTPGKDLFKWSWASEDAIQRLGIKYDSATMTVADMMPYRRHCYDLLKQYVVEGVEHLEEAERRLAAGQSAFEGEPPAKGDPPSRSGSSIRLSEVFSV